MRLSTCRFWITSSRVGQMQRACRTAACILCINNSAAVQQAESSTVAGHELSTHLWLLHCHINPAKHRQHKACRFAAAVVCLEIDKTKYASLLRPVHAHLSTLSMRFNRHGNNMPAQSCCGMAAAESWAAWWPGCATAAQTSSLYKVPGKITQGVSPLMEKHAKLLSTSQSCGQARGISRDG